LVNLSSREILKMTKNKRIKDLEINVRSLAAVLESMQDEILVLSAHIRALTLVKKEPSVEKYKHPADAIGLPWVVTPVPPSNGAPVFITNSTPWPFPTVPTSNPTPAPKVTGVWPFPNDFPLKGDVGA